ncbi:MAG TPA: sugar transferase [Bacteroidetes bacterium]|nr:sugar transferase [Bacteroidota bacterium]
MPKRLFDIIASIFGLLLLSPLLIVIALMIKISMPGPVLFCQNRTGRYGKPFTIYKFRTMIVNHGGSTVSVKGENRITPLGSRLRKYKLDELPELWNVLTGDMSLVGPRPDVPEYYETLSGEEKKILELRPGITGPASIKYSNEEEILESVADPKKYNDEILWPDKVRINLEYYRNRSFWGDIALIFKTIFKKGEKKDP